MCGRPELFPGVMTVRSHVSIGSSGPQPAEDSPSIGSDSFHGLPTLSPQCHIRSLHYQLPQELDDISGIIDDTGVLLGYPEGGLMPLGVLSGRCRENLVIYKLYNDWLQRNFMMIESWRVAQRKSSSPLERPRRPWRCLLR